MTDHVERQPACREARPAVSVCIPTFNRASYLAGAIESVLAQTYGDFELVVSDNASTDETPEVVRSFRDPRIRYSRNHRNLGGPANWLRAFNAAIAPYSAILSDDDRWAPHFLETLVQPLEERPSVDVAFSDHWVIDEAGVILVDPTESYSRSYRRDRLPAGEHRPFLEVAMVSQSIAVSAALLRRKRVQELNALDARAGLPLDYYLFAALALGGGGAFYVPSRLAYSRAHAGTLRATRELQIARDMQWVCHELYARVPEGPLRGELRRRWSQAASSEAYALLRQRQRRRAMRSLLRSVRLWPLGLRAWSRLPGALILAFSPGFRVVRALPRPSGSG